MKQLTRQEMNKVLLEEVPLEERLRFTYVPLYLTDVATLLTTEVLDELAKQRVEKTHKVSRELRTLIRDADKQRYNTMGLSLYNVSKGKAALVVKELGYDLLVYRTSFHNFLRNEHSYSFEDTEVLSKSFVAAHILEYITKYDLESIQTIKNYVAGEFTYTASPDPFPIALRKHLVELIKVFGADPKWETPTTELSYQVFKNRVNLIDVNP